MNNNNTLTLEDARILFRNFKGVEGQYNREGDRNFAVIIDEPKIAKQLEEDGWNVKYLKPREENEEPTPYLQVTVAFKGRPPSVYMITSKGKTRMEEETLELLDYVDIRQADMILNPYAWTVNGKSGIKAYLKNLYITVEEDELDRKYSDVPDLDEDPNFEPNDED